jgi:uncharacterized repeat protein (TIGR03803 family)
LTSIWTFTGGSDGARPFAPLIADDSGALYGTTGNGGTLGNGIIFKLTPPKFDQTSWNLQPIWNFTGGADGSEPDASLIFDKAGALYGTTYVGGASGLGVVFKLTPPRFGQTSWSQQTLWSFTGGSDGGDPLAAVIADQAGALYGTTNQGGSQSNGVVFKLTPPKFGQTAWTDTTLWTFSGGSDGGVPDAPLIADGRGAIYGTTQFGGSFPPIATDLCTGFGCGVVFKLTGTGFVPGHSD